METPLFERQFYKGRDCVKVNINCITEVDTHRHSKEEGIIGEDWSLEEHNRSESIEDYYYYC